MQNWQKERNYQKYTREDGGMAYVVTVDGMDVEVSAEVYVAYAQGDRRERYQAERDSGRVLSLERMDEDEVLLSYLTDEHAESAEEAALRKMDAGFLRGALESLTPEEQELVQRLYFEGVSIREYARRKGLSDFTIRYRERGVLAKLKKIWGN